MLLACRKCLKMAKYLWYIHSSSLFTSWMQIIYLLIMPSLYLVRFSALRFLERKVCVWSLLSVYVTQFKLLRLLRLLTSFHGTSCERYAIRGRLSTSTGEIVEWVIAAWRTCEFVTKERHYLHVLYRKTCNICWGSIFAEFEGTKWLSWETFL